MASNSDEITGNIEDYLKDDSDGSSISSLYDEIEKLEIIGNIEDYLKDDSDDSSISSLYDENEKLKITGNIEDYLKDDSDDSSISSLYDENEKLKITGNIEDYLKDDSDDSSISSLYDENEKLENELNGVEFSQIDLLILCNRTCYVDLKKLNLYYEYEKYIKKLFKKRNYEYIPEKHSYRVYNIFKNTFSKLYTKYYLNWEEVHKKCSKQRFLENKKQSLEFLNSYKEIFDSFTFSLNSSTDTEDNNNSEIRKRGNNDETENSESEQIESDLNDFLHNSIDDYNSNEELTLLSYSEFNDEIECSSSPKNQQMP